MGCPRPSERLWVRTCVVTHKWIQTPVGRAVGLDSGAVPMGGHDPLDGVQHPGVPGGLSCIMEFVVTHTLAPGSGCRDQGVGGLFLFSFKKIQFGCAACVLLQGIYINERYFRLATSLGGFGSPGCQCLPDFATTPGGEGMPYSVKKNPAIEWLVQGSRCVGGGTGVQGVFEDAFKRIGGKFDGLK